MNMSNRDHECDHAFPFSVYSIGYTGETMAEARERPVQVDDAAARRAAKPRIPLRTRLNPPVDCVPCRG